MKWLIKLLKNRKYYWRYANKNDFATVYDIRNDQDIRKNLINHFPIDFEDHCKFWFDKYLKDNNWWIYLVYNWKKDFPVGYCDLKINDDEKSVEIGFKILSEYQGKGAGAWCMDKILNFIHVELSEYSRVWLTVFANNDKAIKFYDKYDFVIVDRINFKRDGKFLELYYMERRILKELIME